MYIEVQKTKTNEYIFLRSSTRDKKTAKIIKKTLANLTHEPVEQVMALVNTVGLVIYFIMKLFKSYYKHNPPKKVFYDVTSLYVEGDYSDSELVTYGYNRDSKKGKFR